MLDIVRALRKGTTIDSLFFKLDLLLWFAGGCQLEKRGTEKKEKKPQT